MMKKLFAILTTGAVLFAGNALTAEAFEVNDELVPCGYTDEMPVVTDGCSVLTIGTVEISPKELEENDYTVKVPVTVTGTKFYELGFGVGFDTSEITPAKFLSGESIKNACEEGFTAVPLAAINTELGIAWCGITVVLNTGSEFIDEGNVMYIKVKVNENAKPGDVYTLINLADNSDYQLPGRVVEYQTIALADTKEHQTSELIDGAIIITNNPIQEELMTVGDADLDNCISMADIIHVSKYTTGAIEFNEHAMFNADCYADGIIDSRDLDTMAMYMRGEIDSLPFRPAA